MKFKKIIFTRWGLRKGLEVNMEFNRAGYSNLSVFLRIVCAAVLVGSVIMILIFISKENTDVVKKEEGLSLTVWEGRYQDKLGDRVMVLRFMDRDVIVRQVELDYERLYDYDFNPEEKSGLIYFYPKKELVSYFENYGIDDLLRMEFPVLAEFKKEGDKLSYQGIDFVKISTDKAIEIEKEFGHIK
jgi:hypothetical protein